MKNKEHFKRSSMKFLLKFWSGVQIVYINLRGGRKFLQICLRYVVIVKRISLFLAIAFAVAITFAVYSYITL